MLLQAFGPESEWPDQDLVGFSDEFDPMLTLAAYQSGVFPMPLGEVGGGVAGPDAMGWWSPVHRGILPLDRLRVSRSLRKSARRYTTSVDRAFDEVMERCAAPTRTGGWIDARVQQVFSDLHRAGWVHSIEVWDDRDRLVGGLYGVSMGGLFAGESMFHDEEFGRDASKVALVRLVEELHRGITTEGRLLDVQWVTPHLASLGAVEVPRRRYLAMVAHAVEQPMPAWPAPEGSTRPVLLVQDGSHA
ncbi:MULTISPECIES: leucyl/phenylalanyl-tRNA--protein transferase [Aestuariimicrobium]|uniref:leucyl/phenylalanyl-tRNA--protein transferase n=1 Tax=Aestuariimicrobium TaxID=396388 RepID=UPI0003B796F0|nr:MULTISPECIES: leucyl/phenylalanyl-tRNA--protein transferase [Aestuariimicrobium]CAI9402578.1 Leucyl/phenylalanyl-tRNA--protein transferase [Aestuariimicrobium sp. T2.26MG-19.2B]